MSLNNLFDSLEEEKTHVDLSPMIDMVFLLLLFFIVTTTFDKSEAIEIQKAQTKSSSPVKKEKLKILLDSAGGFWLGEDRLALDILVPEVKSWTVTNPEGVVLLIPDKRAEMDGFVKLLDELKLIQVSNLAIGSQKASAQP
jgi:biopolymer transport protein ExbD